MTDYNIEVRFHARCSGSTILQVEADSEEEAIKKAEEITDNIDWEDHINRVIDVIDDYEVV